MVPRRNKSGSGELGLMQTLIKISLLEGRVMTNASALPVQRQVLEQLFITDPKVGFGQAALL